MRCPDCNKFVGQEPGDPENNSLEIDSAGNVSAEVRIVVNCAECGTELKEATLNFDDDISEHLKGHLADDEGSHELEIEEEDLESIEDYKRRDRRGKIITNPRYQTHLYGARLAYVVRCSCQDQEDPETKPLHSGCFEDTTEASAMDELV